MDRPHCRALDPACPLQGRGAENHRRATQSRTGKGGALKGTAGRGQAQISRTLHRSLGDDCFSMALGGGLDIALNRALALRVANLE